MQTPDSTPVSEGAPVAVTGPPASPDSLSHAQSHVPTHFARGTGQKLAIAIIVFAVVLAVAFVLVHHSQSRALASLAEETRDQADQPVSVDVVRAEYASPLSLLSLPGEARAMYQTTIYARVNGYLKKWNVDIGDRVKAGQVLAEIEAPDLDDQLSEAKAKVAATKAEAHLAEAAVSFAKLTFQRWESAAPDGIVSQQERDQKKADLDNAVARLDAAGAQIKLAEADVQRLTTLSKFKDVVAPFDGVITRRHVDIGDLVTAGSTTNTSPLFSIAQSDQIRVLISVPQSASPEIKVGMEALATSQEHPGERFVGKVDRTSGAIDPHSKTLDVEVLIPNADHHLLPGMYLQVSFQTSRHNPPLKIPASALAFRSGGPQVAVVADDGRVTFHDIQIARDLGDVVEVSSGLHEGDKVALNISHDISTGDRVTAISTESSPGPAAPATQPATARLAHRS